MTKHDKDTHPKLALKKIMGQGETSTEKMVLCALWVHSDKNGECWPSVKSIMEDTSLSKASVFRALAVLCDNDIVTRYENPKVRATAYKINCGKRDTLTQRHKQSHCETNGLTQRHSGSHTETDEFHTETDEFHTETNGSHSERGTVSHRDCIYNEEHPNELPSEHPNEIRGKEKRKKETSPTPKIPQWEKPFEEVLEEVKDKPFLERMAYAVKAHPMAAERYQHNFITAIESVGYDILDDFKAEAERLQRAGEPLNDWHRGVLNNDWRYKDMILDHYQHRQNTEKHLFGEPIDPEAYKEFGGYYDTVFRKFENKIKDLFLDIAVKEKDPQWRKLFNRYGDGPWTFRKYTRS